MVTVSFTICSRDINSTELTEPLTEGHHTRSQLALAVVYDYSQRHFLQKLMSLLDVFPQHILKLQFKALGCSPLLSAPRIFFLAWSRKEKIKTNLEKIKFSQLVLSLSFIRISVYSLFTLSGFMKMFSFVYLKKSDHIHLCTLYPFPSTSPLSLPR